MVDLSLDSNFSVFLNDRNEIATVDGRDEFEQSVRVALTHYMHQEIIGESDKSIIKEKIKLQVSQVAQEHNRISGIQSIEVRDSVEKPNTYAVRIYYESDSLSQFEVSE